MAALGLRCCVQAFSSCSERGATLRCSVRASHCGGFSCCRAWALGTRASVVVVHGLSRCGSRALEHRLSSCGLVAQQHVASSPTRVQTRVPCFGRRIPNHCTTRVVHIIFSRQPEFGGNTHTGSEDAALSGFLRDVHVTLRTIPGHLRANKPVFPRLHLGH